MPDLEWLRPGWLALVVAGPGLAWLLGRYAGSPHAWRRICDAALLSALLVGNQGRPRRAPFVLLGAGFVLAGLALAGPSREDTDLEAWRSAAARVVVLDLSRSMNATDVGPSRLVRARFKVTDLLQRGDDLRLGLVVYAGDAFVVTPLTRDSATLTALLPALEPGVMPVQGTRADRGLALARDLLEQGDAPAGQVILVTDGVRDRRAVEEAAALRARGFRVSVLAIGTSAGAPVPMEDGRLLLDDRGDLVMARLDLEPLEAIAAAGGGRLATLTLDDRDLESLLASPGQEGEGWTERIDSAASVRRDLGPWLVLGLLPLAALAFRRGWLLGLAALPLLLPPLAEANGGTLWERAEQRSARLLAEGDYEAAAAATRDPAWIGSALYHAGRYREAAELFAREDGITAHYNRGTALAKAGRLREALAAFDIALARAPDHSDALHNRDLVARLLAGGGWPGAGGEPGDSGDDRSRSGGRGDEEGALPDLGEEDFAEGDLDWDPDDMPSGVDRGPTGEGGWGTGRTAGQAPGTDDLSSGADGDAAVEAWLRRIPDDPGGLLRRKFALQYERRGGSPPDGEESAW